MKDAKLSVSQVCSVQNDAKNFDSQGRFVKIDAKLSALQVRLVENDAKIFASQVRSVKKMRNFLAHKYVQ